MVNQKEYYFNHIESCNMCGSSSTTHQLLGKRLNGSQGKNPKKKIGITTSVLKCKKCSLIFSNPQPVPTNILSHYGVAPESYWKDDYLNVSESYFAGEIEKLSSLIEFKSGMKSLDIGAGLGHQMRALEKVGFEAYGFEAYGFEASQQFHERAITKVGISPQKLKLAKIEEVEYPENEFDFISFGAVLEHLYDPSASIIKAVKWLNPNGIIHIEVPSSDWLIGKWINNYYKLRCMDYVGNLSPMHEPYHLYEFNLKSFKEHALKNQYEIAFHEYYVCDTFMPKILDGLLYRYMKRTNKGMQLCVWLRKLS